LTQLPTKQRITVLHSLLVSSPTQESKVGERAC